MQLTNYPFTETGSPTARAESSSFVKPVRSLSDQKEFERRDTLIGKLKSEVRHKSSHTYHTISLNPYFFSKIYSCHS